MMFLKLLLNVLLLCEPASSKPWGDPLLASFVHPLLLIVLLESDMLLINDCHLFVEFGCHVILLEIESEAIIWVKRCASSIQNTDHFPLWLLLCWGLIKIGDNHSSFLSTFWLLFGVWHCWILCSHLWSQIVGIMHIQWRQIGQKTHLRGMMMMIRATISLPILRMLLLVSNLF